jgi:transketolase
MRKEFAELLHKEMQSNQNIFCITADLGFGVLDAIKEDFPNNFSNCGASEMLMAGIVIGLTESGKTAIAYSISSFLLYRPFEMWRNYVSYEKIPVKLVGSGRDRDYSEDGISHWSEDSEIVLKALPHIKIYKPNTIKELENQFNEFLYSKEPAYLNLKRSI